MRKLLWEVEAKCVFNVCSLFLVEADQELEKSTESRGLNDEDIKNEKPSEILEAIEKGLSAIATVLTDDVET